MCAPLIMIAEMATGGALSAAIGGALGSQILGGAVLGLISSGGNPLGAVLGGLGGVVSGGLAGATGSGAEAVAAVGETASEASNIGALIENSVGNEGLTSAMDMSGALATDTASAATESVAGKLATDGLADEATRGFMDGTLDPSASMESASSVSSTAARTGSSVAGEAAGKLPSGVDAAKKAGLLEGFEGFAKSNPMMAKIGLGAIQGLGKSMAENSAIKKKLQAQKDLEEERRRRAFGGLNFALPFQPNMATYAATATRPPGPIGAVIGAQA